MFKRMNATVTCFFITALMLYSCGSGEKSPGNEKNELTDSASVSEQKTAEPDYSGIYVVDDEKLCNIIITLMKEGTVLKYSISGANTAYTGEISATTEGGSTYLNFSGKVGDNPENSLRALYKDNTLTIQNYGNSINEFVYFKECDAKYIVFNRK